MTANYKPEGYHTVTPYLTVRGASRLLEFLKQASDAQQKELMMRPDGTSDMPKELIPDDQKKRRRIRRIATSCGVFQQRR